MNYHTLHQSNKNSLYIISDFRNRISGVSDEVRKEGKISLLICEIKSNLSLLVWKSQK